MSDNLDSMVERMKRSSEEHWAKITEFLKSRPQSIQCPKHPDVALAILPVTEHSRCEAKYSPCPVCRAEAVRLAEDRRLHAAGVPSNLLHATLDNWLPRDPAEQAHLECVREFAAIRRGFLLLLGSIGTGKTHLAIGVMRNFAQPVLFKQNSLLRALRATYRDPDAPDPIPSCQNADLLVLDEAGVSVGGRDEYPALHEIIDHRFGEFLPTIVTSNLSPSDLREALGERLMDRLAQAAFKVLTFGGPSHRRELRDQYRLGERYQPGPESWLDV